MVLYNSPFAVAALLLGLAFVGLGLHRVLRILKAPPVPPDAHHLRASARDAAGLSETLRKVIDDNARETILAIVGTLLLVAALVTAIAQDLSR